MLPLNKVFEDVQTFVIAMNVVEKAVVGTNETKESEIVNFANDLSEKYGELVSVKLVKSLIAVCEDSMEKDESNGI